MRVKPYSKCLGNVEIGSKARVAFCTERAVETLTTEAGVFAYLRPSFGASNISKARGIPAASSGASSSQASRYTAISCGVLKCSDTSYGVVSGSLALSFTQKFSS